MFVDVAVRCGGSFSVWTSISFWYALVFCLVMNTWWFGLLLHRLNGNIVFANWKLITIIKFTYFFELFGNFLFCFTTKFTNTLSRPDTCAVHTALCSRSYLTFLFRFDMKISTYHQPKPHRNTTIVEFFPIGLLLLLPRDYFHPQNVVEFLCILSLRHVS